MDSACALLEMAVALKRRGLHVEVLAPRYASAWPETITVREVPVHRVVAAPRSDWSMGKYVRGLTAWLHDHAESYDVLFADSIREEAMAVAEVGKTRRVPTMVRCQGWGAMSDVQWWESSRAARRCATAGRCADITIAHDAGNQRALVVHGFDPARIERIQPGFPVMPVSTAQRRQEARRALAAANSDLQAELDAPVILCNARMTRDGGINLLVQAAHNLVVRYPNLRIWFIGDGPYRDWIYQHLRSEGVRASIAMPGSFSDPVDLFFAADVYLQSEEAGLDHFLPVAIATELPVVSVDLPSIRSLLDDGWTVKGSGLEEDGDGSIRAAADRATQTRPSELIHWCESPSSKEVRVSLTKVLRELPEARRKAEQLRRMLVRSRPLGETMEAYVRLIENLSSRSNGCSVRSGKEALS